MNKHEIEVLRAAGDFYAISHRGFRTDIIDALNPYYFAEPDAEPPRPTEQQKLRAVEHLLALIEASSGENAADDFRQKLRLRCETREAGATPVILDLDEDLWLRCADLVCIRALEVIARQPLGQVMTTAEVEAAYGLAPGTAKKAAQRGQIPAERRGNNWLISRADADQRWGRDEPAL